MRDRHPPRALEMLIATSALLAIMMFASTDFLMEKYEDKYMSSREGILATADGLMAAVIAYIIVWRSASDFNYALLFLGILRAFCLICMLILLIKGNNWTNLQNSYAAQEAYRELIIMHLFSGIVNTCTIVILFIKRKFYRVYTYIVGYFHCNERRRFRNPPDYEVALSRELDMPPSYLEALISRRPPEFDLATVSYDSPPPRREYLRMDTDNCSVHFIQEAPTDGDVFL